MSASIVIEPWQSGFMLFMIPGLIGWIIGAVLWARDQSTYFAICLQVICAIEVAIGGGVAYLRGLAVSNSGLIATGQFDPLNQAADQTYMGAVATNGIVLHLILLLATLAMAVLTLRRNRKAQQDTDPNRVAE